jgi:hypothetical protein
LDVEKALYGALEALGVQIAPPLRAVKEMSLGARLASDSWQCPPGTVREAVALLALPAEGEGLGGEGCALHS